MKITNLVLIALALTESSALVHLKATYKGLGPYEFIKGTCVDDFKPNFTHIYNKHQWKQLGLLEENLKFSKKQDMITKMKDEGWARVDSRTAKHLHKFEKDNNLIVACTATGTQAVPMSHLTATYQSIPTKRLYEFVGGTRWDDTFPEEIKQYNKNEWDHVDLRYRNGKWEHRLERNYSNEKEMIERMKDQGWARVETETAAGLYTFEKDTVDTGGVEPQAVETPRSVSSPEDTKQWIVEATYEKTKGPNYLLIEAKENGTKLEIKKDGINGCEKLRLRREFNSWDKLLDELKGWTHTKGTDDEEGWTPGDDIGTTYKFGKSRKAHLLVMSPEEEKEKS